MSKETEVYWILLCPSLCGPPIYRTFVSDSDLHKICETWKQSMSPRNDLLLTKLLQKFLGHPFFLSPVCVCVLCYFQFAVLLTFLKSFLWMKRLSRNFLSPPNMVDHLTSGGWSLSQGGVSYSLLWARLWLQILYASFISDALLDLSSLRSSFNINLL